MRRAQEPRLILQITGRGLNNRELDKLVGALGRSKATWRRALLLHDWLQSVGHHPDDRLCTTLIRYVVLPSQESSPFYTTISMTAPANREQLVAFGGARHRAGIYVAWKLPQESPMVASRIALQCIDCRIASSMLSGQ